MQLVLALAAGSQGPQPAASWTAGRNEVVVLCGRSCKDARTEQNNPFAYDSLAWAAWTTHKGGGTAALSVHSFSARKPQHPPIDHRQPDRNRRHADEMAQREHLAEQQRAEQDRAHRDQERDEQHVVAPARAKIWK